MARIALRQGVLDDEEREQFAFDKARLGNTHMWVDPNMAPPHALITDALYDALREAKVELFHDSGSHPEI